jgi:hypothetical protein
MDELILIGAPFVIFLIAAAWIGYSIARSGSAAERSPVIEPASGGATDETPATGSERHLPGAGSSLTPRLRRAGLVLLAAALTALGAAAATAAGAFGRLTDAGFALEPAALVLGFEAAVDLVIALVCLRGLSAAGAWVMRLIGGYWLCVAAPVMILADGGPGWISASPGFGMTLLGLPSFGWEAVAVVAPALLIWRASRRPSV